MKQAPFKAAWKKRMGIVRHGFTHFELEIEVYVAEAVTATRGCGSWTRDLSTVALPTVMKKILNHALSEDGPHFARRSHRPKHA
jgi:A/G-specific adenine glycosylase